MADKITKATETLTGQIMPETGITFEGVICKRYGNAVYLYVATGSNMPLSLTRSFTKIATVPQGFRPSSAIIRTCIIYDESGRNRTEALIQFGYGGNISIAALENGTYGFLRGECSFII